MLVTTRGGLHSDPDIRRRQEEGLAKGRQIAAERRRLGLPSKRKERELEQRVIEGGQRGGDRQQTRREEQSNDGTTPATARRERQSAAGDEAAEIRVPWYAPLYTGRSNADVLAEDDPES